LADQPLAHQVAAGIRQPGFAIQRVDQYLQGLSIIVIAEVTESVGTLAGLTEQLVDIQRLACSLRGHVHTASCNWSILTTRVLGWHWSCAPTQRRHSVPWRSPAVCSQLATPGSRSLSTRVTPPLPSYSACCLLKQIR